MFNLNRKTIFIIGLTAVIVGFTIFMSNYFSEKKSKAYDYMNNQFLVLSQSEIPDQSEDVEVEEEPEEELEELEETPAPQATPQVVNSYYAGSLEIPKLGFKRGFVDVNSADNHVDKNITVVKSSNYPDVDKGNFIIAGHSGSGPLAFFKNLYQLEVGDVAVVNYKNKKYTYRITKIYLQERTGRIAIYRDYDKTTLTLVTCTKDNKTKQTVYIAELVS